MRKVIILTLFFLILGGIFCFLTYKTSQQRLSTAEKKRALVQILGRKAETNPTPIATGWTTYGGKYLSLSYPQATSIYDKDTEQAYSNPNLLEKFEFYHAMPRWDVVVMAQKANGAVSLDDNSGVLMRKRNPDQYQSKSLRVGLYNALEFINQDGHEYLVVFLANDHFYSVAMTGSLDQEIFNKTLSSLRVK